LTQFFRACCLNSHCAVARKSREPGQNTRTAYRTVNRRIGHQVPVAAGLLRSTITSKLKYYCYKYL